MKTRFARCEHGATLDEDCYDCRDSFLPPPAAPEPPDPARRQRLAEIRDRHERDKDVANEWAAQGDHRQPATSLSLDEVEFLLSSIEYARVEPPDPAPDRSDVFSDEYAALGHDERDSDD